MSGLPGSGKSTVAEALAQKLRLPIFSVDPLESAIIKSGIAKSFETGVAAYLTAQTLAAAHLKLGQSVIIDAVNAEEEGKNVWREVARGHKVTMVIIECLPGDTKLHKQRIEARVRNLHGIPEVTWDRVQTRRQVYTAWEEPTLQLDTSKDLTTNVQRALDYINQNNQ